MLNILIICIITTIKIYFRRKANIIYIVSNQHIIVVFSSAKTLQVSYIGMQTQEVVIKPRLKVVLKVDAQQLEEVMVVAYGTAKKQSFTGSADMVKSDQIEKRTVANLSKALEGTAPGIQMTSGGGQPGEASKVVIRGFGSINASNNPLYVLDGIPFDGDLSSINPADIESMSVLKDASSAALYGARGANGVIMITTKKGKEGKPTVNLKASWGVTSRAFPRYNTVNAKEFMEATFEGYKNYLLDDGETDSDAREIAAGDLIPTLGGYNPFNVSNDQLIDPTTGRLNSNAQLLYQDDWMDEATKDSPLRQEYQFSVSGGNNNTNYNFSLGYLNEDGLAVNTGFERFSGRMNIDSQIKKWLKSGLSASFSTTTQDYTFEDGGSAFYNIWYSSEMIAPIYPVYKKNADGSNLLVDGEKEYDYGVNRPSFSNMNWIAALYQDKRERKSDNLSSRAYVTLSGKDYEELGFFKDFTLTSNIGIDYRNRNTLNYYNPDEGDAAGVGGDSYRSATRMLSYTFNQLLNYNKTFNKHSLDVLVGHEFYSYENLLLSAERQGFPFNGLQELANGAQIIGGTSYKDIYKIESVFGRINYSFSDRYYLSGSYRTDGSSRFHKDNRWGSFWSLGGAWRISEEAFMSGAKSWLNSLTLKASYGVQGNDAIVDKDGYETYYGWQSLYDMDYANASMSGALLYSLENKSLKWEKNKNLNIGIEGTLLDSRLRVSLEYYIKKTSDLLLMKPKATSTGVNGYYDNVGAMENKGIDLSISGDIFNKKDFSWTMGIMLSSFKNKITELTSGTEQIVLGTTILKVGEPIRSFYMAKSAGVDPETGSMLYWIKDDQGNWIKDSNYNKANSTDRQLCGSRIPDFYGSWNNSFTYKNFDLSFLFTFSVGGKVYDSKYANLMSTRNVGQNFHKDMLNAWKAPGDITDVPRMVLLANDQISDRFLINASYLSLKNITLGYNLPKKWLQKAGISNIRIFATGDNLFLISALKGMDPQYNFTGSQDYTYTPVRNITFGFDLKF